MSGTPIYEIWSAIIARCENKKNISYANYGGRGITVCESWRNSFSAFYKDMGDRPTGAWIDRIDNDGHYCAANCKWSTRKEQANNRRSNAFITFNGETHSIAQWAEKVALPRAALDRRLRLGWPIARALTEPKGGFARASKGC